jgi:hypothetical protein
MLPAATKVIGAIVAPFLAMSLAIGQPLPPNGEMRVSADAKGTISIVAIEPDPGIPLRIGESVHLRLVVKCTTAIDETRIKLIVQGANVGEIVRQEEPVKRGASEKTFSVDFTVPDTLEVDVLLPLFSPRQGYLDIAQANYRVRPAK